MAVADIGRRQPGPDAADAGRGPTVAPAPGKLAAQVATRIEIDVVRRGWPVGESLGSEPDLRERYGVSRAVLREAVRLVEHHQVARMRRGPGGGLVVGVPDPQASVAAMALYLQHRRVSGPDLVAVREAIELGVVTRVVDRHADTQVTEELDAALGGDVGRRGRADHFHLVMAELGGNPVLALFLRILTELWGRHSDTRPRDIPAEALAEVERVHRRIAEAVITGDEGLARHRMRRHLAALTDWWH